MFYFLPFVIAVGCVVVLLRMIRSKHIERFLYSPTHARHTGGRQLVRSGGVAVALVFMALLVLHPDFIIDEKTRVIFVASVALLIVGIIDDVRSLSWRVQLSAQILAVGAVAYAGVRLVSITSPFGGIISFEHGGMIIVGIIMMIVWVVGIINVLNWSDGMHGVFGGVGVIASGTLFILALRPEVYQPPVALMTATLGGAMLGFTFMNVWGKRIIAGTSGTYFFGFLIAVLAIFAGAKIGTTLLVLIVPLVDALYVLHTRFRTGKKLTAADTTHLHHRLLERGWRQSHILIAYYSLTLCGAVLALSTQTIGKLAVFIIYAVVLLASFFFLTHQTKSNDIS